MELSKARRCLCKAEPAKLRQLCDKSRENQFKDGLAIIIYVTWDLKKQINDEPVLWAFTEVADNIANMKDNFTKNKEELTLRLPSIDQ